MFISRKVRTDLHLSTQANRVREVNVCRVGNELEQQR